MRVRCECAPSLHRDPAHHYGATSGHHTHIIYLLEEWRKGVWRQGENGACTKHLASTKIWFVYVCICFNLYSICVSISYCVWMANLPVDSLDCSFSLHKLSLSLSQSLSRYTCFSFLFLFMFCKNLKPLFLSHKLSLSLSLPLTFCLFFSLKVCIYLFQCILLTYSPCLSFLPQENSSCLLFSLQCLAVTVSQSIRRTP